MHFIVLAYTQHAVPDCTLTAKDELWLAKKAKMHNDNETEKVEDYFHIPPCFRFVLHCSIISQNNYLYLLSFYKPARLYYQIDVTVLIYSRSQVRITEQNRARDSISSETYACDFHDNRDQNTSQDPIKKSSDFLRTAFRNAS